MNFLQALEQITEHWSPRVVGRVNDQYVKVAKVQGQLAWHKHDSEDEMFLVVYGRLVLQFEDKEVKACGQRTNGSASKRDQHVGK